MVVVTLACFTSFSLLYPSSHQASAIDQLVEGNELDEALVARDAAANAAAQLPEEDLGPPGAEEFLDDVYNEASQRGILDSNDVQSIMKHTNDHRYDDEEPNAWGKGTLVPHLQMAGLWDAALKVQSMQYKF